MLARLRPYILLFLGLTVVYHANLRPVDSSDSLGASLIPFSLILDHTITLDRFAPWLQNNVWSASAVLHQAHGHYFSSFPIGAPLLVSPLYLPLAFAARHWDPGSLVIVARVAEKFGAVTVAALSAVLLLLLLERITTAGWAWCLTLVYALATETWSISSQALWQQGPGNLAIIGCFYCLERWSQNRMSNRWLWLCGSSAAAAFVIRPTNVVLAFGVIAALLLTKAPLRQHVRLISVPVLAGVLLASYNYGIFHRLSGGYPMNVMKGSILRGLAGLFLSPGRGILIYTPVLLFALSALLPSAATGRRQHNPLFVTAIVFIFLDSLFIARSIIWWGGYSWGPRLLTELIPALIVLMALGVSVLHRPWPRRTLAVLALYSLLIQTIGVFFYPNGHWDGTPESVDRAPGRLWNWEDNPIVRTLHGGLYWEPYAVVGAAVTGGFSGAQRRMHELNVDPYEQAQPAKLPHADPGLP